jgi:hypothetical protein
MSAVGQFTLFFLLAVISMAPRRWAVLGIFGGVLYTTMGQVVDVLGLNMYPMRILTLAAFVRVLVRREFLPSEINDIDRLLVVVYAYRCLISIIAPNVNVTEAVGTFVDATVAYFAFRGLIKSIADLKWILYAFAIIAIPYLFLLYVESSTADNPFAMLGGINRHLDRDGRIRCNGSFEHAILLGTFGASLLPMFVGLGLLRHNRLGAALGITVCLTIVFFSNSGAPLICVLITIVGWLCWFLRTKMAAVRASIVAMFIASALVIKDPIWYLPAKISGATGGHGWHRSYLMDVAFQNLDKWWVSGMPLEETNKWFPYALSSGSADVTNYYLDFGFAGGVAAMILFCCLLVVSYSRLGRALRAVRTSVPALREEEMMLWSVGIVLTVHVFNWISVWYFDQMYVVFFMQLATLSTFSSRYLRNARQAIPQISAQDATRSTSKPGTNPASRPSTRLGISTPGRTRPAPSTRGRIE